MAAATEVVYLPPRMDSHGGTSTRALREGPIWLTMKDAGVLIKMLHYLPNIFLPFKASRLDDELALTFTKIPELAIEVILFVLELFLLFAIPISILVFPGFLVIPACTLAYLLIYLLCWPLHGPNLCYSQTATAEENQSAEHFADERWIFVNGCMTNRAGLQDNVNRLSEKFHRDVIGIHNKSFGLIADLLECLIQRSFAYKTSDVRIAYTCLKPFLMDDTVRKVVLIGHSQGGLIISLVLDQLLAEIPLNNVSKLEIYTFGSAASHMSNPPTQTRVAAETASEQPQAQPNSGLNDDQSNSNSPLSHLNATALSSKPPQHLIQHIEHYANEYDLVPRWGVLHSVYNIQNNRYAGSVFVRRHRSGHMFNQHYLDHMFSPSVATSSEGKGTTFLDRPIAVDFGLVASRVNAPNEEIEHLKRKTSSGLMFGSGEKVKARTVGIAANVVSMGEEILMFNRTGSGGVAGEEVVGRTVRDVSRLWRYLEGGRPEG